MKTGSKRIFLFRIVFGLLAVTLPIYLVFWGKKTEIITGVAIALCLIPSFLNRQQQKKELLVYYLICYFSFTLLSFLKSPIETTHIYLFSFFLIHFFFYRLLDKLSYKKYDEGLTLLSQADLISGVHSGRFSIIDLLYTIAFFIITVLFFYYTLSD